VNLKEKVHSKYVGENQGDKSLQRLKKSMGEEPISLRENEDDEIFPD
jgi:hypothetical protein